MQFLNNKEDLYEGNILKVTRKEHTTAYTVDNFEGYAILIKPEGKPMSFMPGDEKSSVFISERWLIRWAELDELPKQTKPKERFNQSFLAGQKTHRVFSYKASNTFGLYIKEYGLIKEDPIPKIPKIINDDENFIF